jgi:DNA-binding transcriptional MerR regulator
MTYSIGDVSRRTGLTVKTIRFYSDQGVVPSTRSPAGYRQYDAEALARLELVRALRDLGLPLATVQQVLDREVPLAEVLTTEADALEVQIRSLRLRQAVVRASLQPSLAATAECSPLRLAELQRLAALPATGRAALVDEFLGSVFTEERPVLAAAQRSMVPELPEGASVDQLEAWVQLAELAQDAGFRELMRELVNGYTGDGLRPHDVARVRRAVAPALALGIDPRSAEADDYLAAVGEVDVDQLALAADVRRERYFDLLAVVNGWTTPDSPTDALRWYLEAVSSRP